MPLARISISQNYNFMNKRIFTILIIIGILAIGVGVYFAWKKYGEEIIPLPLSPKTPSTIIIPSADNANKLNILSSQGVVDYWAKIGFSSGTSTVSSGDQGEIFYISSGGVIYKIENNKEEKISEASFANIKRIKASPDGNKIAVQYGKLDPNISDVGAILRIDVYDVSKNIWQSIVGDITAYDWSLDGKKLAYLEKNSKGESDLIIKDLADSKQKETKIFSLNQIGFDIKWVDNDRIFFVSKPAFDVLSEVWEFNLKTKIFSKIIGGKGLMLNWSKFRDSGLKFIVDNKRNYSLQLINNKGLTIGNFKFKTLPDKCFISSPAQIYCAIPRDQDVFNVGIFPDDYLKRSILFADGIYQIDMNINSFKAIFEENEPVIDAINLTLSGNKLFFINRYDSKLYSLEF